MMAQEIIAKINDLADEQLPDAEILSYINDALAEIGREVDATFPVLESKYDEPVIPDKWQRLLLVPYGKGRVKEKDASQFEWQAGYGQFEVNLLDFKSSYKIPVHYQDLRANQDISVNGTLMTTESGDTIHQVALDNGISADALIDENLDDKGNLKLQFVTNSQSYEPSFWGGGW